MAACARHVVTAQQHRPPSPAPLPTPRPASLHRPGPLNASLLLPAAAVAFFAAASQAALQALQADPSPPQPTLLFALLSSFLSLALFSHPTPSCC